MAELRGQLERLIRQPNAPAEDVERALAGLRALQDELFALNSFRQRVQARLDEVINIIFAVAAHDYTQRATIDGEDDLLDGLCTGVNAMTEELQSSTAFGSDILAAMTDMVILAGRDGNIELANDAAVRMLGHAREELLGRPFATIVAGSHKAFTAEDWAREFGGVQGTEALLVGAGGRALITSLSASPLFGLRGEIDRVVFVARDISESKRIEAERMRLAEEVGRKAAEIRELSTPLLPIDDGIIALPLIGSVDEARARQILQTLLGGVARHHARVVILDVTGVAMVDSHVADSILKAVRATRLLGASVVLTGVRTAVARTLSALDVNMSEVVLRSTFKSGIAWARAAVHASHIVR